MTDVSCCDRKSKNREMWNQLTKYTLYYQNESIILLYKNSLISKKKQILFILFVNIKATKREKYYKLGMLIIK